MFYCDEENHSQINLVPSPITTSKFNYFHSPSIIPEQGMTELLVNIFWGYTYLFNGTKKSLSVMTSFFFVNKLESN